MLEGEVRNARGFKLAMVGCFKLGESPSLFVWLFMWVTFRTFRIDTIPHFGYYTRMKQRRILCAQ